jgi:hypothetical protein
MGWLMLESWHCMNQDRTSCKHLQLRNLSAWDFDSTVEGQQRESEWQRFIITCSSIEKKPRELDDPWLHPSTAVLHDHDRLKPEACVDTPIALYTPGN